MAPKFSPLLRGDGNKSGLSRVHVGRGGPSAYRWDLWVCPGSLEGSWGPTFSMLHGPWWEPYWHPSIMTAFRSLQEAVSRRTAFKHPNPTGSTVGPGDSMLPKQDSKTSFPSFHMPKKRQLLLLQQNLLRAGRTLAAGAASLKGGGPLAATWGWGEDSALFAPSLVILQGWTAAVWTQPWKIKIWLFCMPKTFKCSFKICFYQPSTGGGDDVIILATACCWSPEQMLHH